MTSRVAQVSVGPTAHVVLVGRLGARIESRELPSGDSLVVFTVVVDRRPERGASSRSRARVDAIPCRAFRAVVAHRLDRLQEGDWVRAEGTLRRRFWRAGVTLGSAVEVEVVRLERYRPTTE